MIRFDENTSLNTHPTHNLSRGRLGDILEHNLRELNHVWRKNNFNIAGIYNATIYFLEFDGSISLRFIENSFGETIIGVYLLTPELFSEYCKESKDRNIIGIENSSRAAFYSSILHGGCIMVLTDNKEYAFARILPQIKSDSTLKEIKFSVYWNSQEQIVFDQKKNKR